MLQFEKIINVTIKPTSSCCQVNLFYWSETISYLHMVQSHCIIDHPVSHGLFQCHLTVINAIEFCNMFEICICLFIQTFRFHFFIHRMGSYSYTKPMNFPVRLMFLLFFSISNFPHCIFVHTYICSHLNISLANSMGFLSTC